MNINGTDDQFYRYKMNKLEVRYNLGRKRTYIINLVDVSNDIDRDIDFIKKYFNKKMSISVNWKKKENELELGGVFELHKLQEILGEMIKEYVLCLSCGNPETKIKYSSSKGVCIQIKCTACGKKNVIKESSDIDVFECMLKYLKSKKKQKKSK